MRNEFVSIWQKSKRWLGRYCSADYLAVIFRPAARKKINDIFFYIFIIFFPFVLSSLLMRPLVRSIQPKELKSVVRSTGAHVNIDYLKDAPLFYTGEERVSIDPAQKCVDSTKYSQLPVQLLNTIVLQDSHKSMVNLQIAGVAQMIILQENEDLEEYLKLTKIEHDKIVFINKQNGQCEYLAIQSDDKQMSPMNITSYRADSAPRENSSPVIDGTISGSLDESLLGRNERVAIIPPKFDGIVAQGNNVSISKKAMDNALKNMSSILNEAAHEMIKNKDGTLSFKVTHIAGHSIFRALNIEEGDIITMINGQKITNVNELLKLFGQISHLSSVQVGLVRDGEEKSYNYNIK